MGGAVPGFVRLRLRLSVKPITNWRTEHLGLKAHRVPLTPSSCTSRFNCCHRDGERGPGGLDVRVCRRRGKRRRGAAHGHRQGFRQGSSVCVLLEDGLFGFTSIFCVYVLVDLYICKDLTVL